MNETAINNFLSSLDMSLPMIAHYKNCMMDAKLYKWNSKTVVAIMLGIEQRYSKINQGKENASVSV